MIIEAVCFHEAGHAFMYWCVGVKLGSVQVIRNEDRGNQKWLTSEEGKPLVGKTGFCTKDKASIRPAEEEGGDRAVCIRQILISLGGPIASEVYAGDPIAASLASSAGNDADTIGWCRELGGINQDVYEQILAHTRELFDDPRADAAIRKVVSRLIETEGRLEGKEVEAICMDAFGRQPPRLPIF